jgi:transposase InsO family protein
LRKKKAAVERIQHFFSLVERQYGARIHAFRSDRGGEFLSSEFVHWLDQLGILHQLTVPYTPQQTGMVERTNRLLCVVLCAIHRASTQC